MTRLNSRPAWSELCGKSLCVDCCLAFQEYLSHEELASRCRLVLVFVAPQTVHGDDLGDLSTLLQDARNYWPEGAMECEVSGGDVGGESYRVRAYWKNRHYRFEYEPLHTDNTEQHRAAAGWVIIGGGEGFRFQKNNGMAVVARAPDPFGMEPRLQVLPNMLWLNLARSESISDWLNRYSSRPGVERSVSNNSNGSYRLSIKRNDIERLYGEFTKQGLPIVLREVNSLPGEAVGSWEMEWQDVDGEDFPHPVMLVWTVGLADGQSETRLQIKVSEFRTKIKPTDPSFAIPPVDLPPGTPIHDMR